MSIVILISLLLTGFGFCLSRRKKFGFGLVAVSLAIVFLIGNGHVPSLLLDNLQKYEHQSSPAWGERNAIIVLGSGTVKWATTNEVSTNAFSFSRIFESAKHYFSCKREGRNCTIIASGGDPFHNGVSEADVMKRELLAIGVTDADIVTEPNSMNTFQNAEFVSGILKSQKFDIQLLVSSGIHIQRSLLYFSHFEVSLLPAPSDRVAAIPSMLPQAFNFTMADLALHEYVGFARFHAYNMLGLNK